MKMLEPVRDSNDVEHARSEHVILVVDDSPDARDMLCVLLEVEGYATVSASDGYEALELLLAMDPPSLILLDVMMPRMDGLELRERLCADRALASIPIVFISAAPQLLAGGLRYLQKPVAHDVLLQVVREHCG